MSVLVVGCGRHIGGVWCRGVARATSLCCQISQLHAAYCSGVVVALWCGGVIVGLVVAVCYVGFDGVTYSGMVALMVDVWFN